MACDDEASALEKDIMMDYVALGNLPRNDDRLDNSAHLFC
jgi:hypothetical protein